MVGMIIAKMTIAASDTDSQARRPALVVSHERSGTHFLMNTLAANFGYCPYADVDEAPGFDPRSTPQMLGFLLRRWPWQAVLKSHHQVDFFPLLPRLAERFHVFYVVRDPRDALLSFRRFIAAAAPGTGPLAASIGDFLRAAPCGRIVRYQRHDEADMVARWRRHTEGWSAAAAALPGRLTLVRYDDLDERFAATVARLAAALGRPAGAARRPPHDEHVVQPGPGGSGGHRAVLTAADQQLVRAAAGGAMQAVGLPLD
jgi:hypothetical protein